MGALDHLLDLDVPHGDDVEPLAHRPLDSDDPREVDAADAEIDVPLDLELGDHDQLAVPPDQLTVRDRDQRELVPLGGSQPRARGERGVLHNGRLHRHPEHRRAVHPGDRRVLHRDLLPRKDVDKRAAVPMVHPFVLVHLRRFVGIDLELDLGVPPLARGNPLRNHQSLVRNPVPDQGRDGRVVDSEDDSLLRQGLPHILLGRPGFGEKGRLDNDRCGHVVLGETDHDLGVLLLQRVSRGDAERAPAFRSQKLVKKLHVVLPNAILPQKREQVVLGDLLLQGRDPDTLVVRLQLQHSLVQSRTLLRRSRDSSAAARFGLSV